MRYQFCLLTLAGVLSSPAVFAAQSIDLNHQPISTLRPFVIAPNAIAGSVQVGSQVKENNRSTDFNHTTHIRVQQTYAGFPVWGGDAVLHVREANKAKASLAAIATSNTNTDMTGTIYQGLQTDLISPAVLATPEKKQAMIAYAMTLAQKEAAGRSASATDAEFMAYVDDENKAHWAYLVTLSFPATNHKMPYKPVFIIDAQSKGVYEQWNDIQSLSEKHKDSEAVLGGGIGGNVGVGKFSYDGLSDDGHFHALNLTRDPSSKTCYLRNADAVVIDDRDKSEVSFSCDLPDARHNNVYWNSKDDTVNDGYSPNNDAIFAGTMVKQMYQAWLGVPMLSQDNDKPMLLTIMTHAADVNPPHDKAWENAVWDGEQIYLGDGADHTYPLTSIGVIGHEVSHGFTQQHSNLVYNEQSGGLNESFSDMAAQATENFATGKNSWMIGPEIMKQQGVALRYMDQPSKDCGDDRPGDHCSIDNAQQFSKKLNVHYSSGVFNRAFYLLSTAPGWDVKKAFNLMAQANSHYWTKNATFQSAACGVMKAADKDFHYDVTTVSNVFEQVGISTARC